MLFDFEYLLALIHRYYEKRSIFLLHLLTFAPLAWETFALARKISPIFCYILVIVYAAYCVLLEPIAGAIFSIMLCAFVHYCQLEMPGNFNALFLGLFLLFLQLIPLKMFHKSNCKILILFLLFEPFYFCMRLLFALGYRPLLKTKISTKPLSSNSPK